MPGERAPSPHCFDPVFTYRECCTLERALVRPKRREVSRTRGGDQRSACHPRLSIPHG